MTENRRTQRLSLSLASCTMSLFVCVTGVLTPGCSSSAKIQAPDPCDVVRASLPANAPCPPVPVGGFDRLAELVSYPEMFRKAGIEGMVWIELEVLPDSSARVVKATLGQMSRDDMERFNSSILAAIESLKWIRCSPPNADSIRADPVAFPVKLMLQPVDASVDTAFALPGGGVQVIANRIPLPPHVPYGGRMIPARPE